MLDIKPAYTDVGHRLQHQRALARSQSKGGVAPHSEPAQLAPAAMGSDVPP